MPSPAGPGLTFREDVRPADVAAVGALVQATGFFTAEEVAVAEELVEAHRKDGPASGYLFLFAERAGALVGYACFGPIPATEQRYDLYWIAVSPQHQRAGIGRALLTAAEAAIARAGGRRVYIETSSQPVYAPTRTFYAAAGYTLEARLAHFYRDNDDKLIYSRAL